jgi:hypothetical protein
MTKDEIGEAIERLWRKGRIIKTKRMRDGQPVFVARKYATEEELLEDALLRKAQR